MAKKTGPIVQLRNELSSIMNQVKELGNEALNEASDMVTNKLVINTPIDTGATRASWKNVNRYDLVKYIFNTNLSKSGIPVLNLLEFGSKGKPFAVRTFRESFQEIEDKIINSLNKVK